MTDRQKRLTKEYLAFGIKTLIGIAFISPLIIGFLFSFQTDKQLMTYPLKLITDSPTLENYVNVLNTVPMGTYFKNSVIVCFITIFVQLVIACLTAYAFVYFNFPGKKFLFSMILMSMMIPGQVVTITNYVTIQQMGLIDTFLGLTLPSFVGGTSIFMLRQYFLQLPREMKESATIDGCGDMRFLFQIAIPLAIPTIASLAVYMFVNVYNGYFWPLLVTNSDEMRTVQVGISFLVAGDALNYGRVLAGATVAIIPSILIYVFGQDYIIKGMTRGSVKG